MPICVLPRDMGGGGGSKDKWRNSRPDPGRKFHDDWSVQGGESTRLLDQDKKKLQYWQVERLKSPVSGEMGISRDADVGDIGQRTSFSKTPTARWVRL